MAKISLSTCWLSRRHNDGYAMLCEVADLGFEYVELSHGIRLSLVPGILRALEEGIVKVTSVHNFCPLPPGVNYAAPNLYQPSSSSAKELHLWELYTKKTLEFASQVGAQYMVTHLGSVNFPLFNPQKKLEEWQSSTTLSEMRKDEDYKHFIDKSLNKISIKAAKAISNVKKSLDKVIPLAKSLDITIAVENRERILELPMDHAIASILDEYPEQVCYWHDTGHAQMKEQLTVIKHLDLLESNKDRLRGFHIKDTSPEGMDNLPLGDGEINFESIVEFMGPDHICVIEMSPSVVSEEIKQSYITLQNLLGGNYAKETTHCNADMEIGCAVGADG